MGMAGAFFVHQRPVCHFSTMCNFFPYEHPPGHLPQFPVLYIDTHSTHTTYVPSTVHCKFRHEILVFVLKIFPRDTNSFFLFKVIRKKEFSYGKNGNVFLPMSFCLLFLLRNVRTDKQTRLECNRRTVEYSTVQYVQNLHPHYR
jgi:hypothetical protein